MSSVGLCILLPTCEGGSGIAITAPTTPTIMIITTIINITIYKDG